MGGVVSPPLHGFMRFDAPLIEVRPARIGSVVPASACPEQAGPFGSGEIQRLLAGQRPFLQPLAGGRPEPRPGMVRPCPPVAVGGPAVPL